MVFINKTKRSEIFIFVFNKRITGNLYKRTQQRTIVSFEGKANGAHRLHAMEQAAYKNNRELQRYKPSLKFIIKQLKEIKKKWRY